MEPLAWLEVSDARGRLVERVRLDRLPATVGRGYANDVVLADRFVCPRHLRVEHAGDGRFLVEDEGSLNGTFVPPHGEKVARAVVSSGAPFRVGRTALRLLAADTPVEPTLRDGPRPGDEWSPAAVTLAVAAMLALILFGTYHGSYQRTALVDSVRVAVFFAILVLAWAGGWAAASRIVTHRWRLSAHVAVVCTVLVLSSLFELGLQYVDFALSLGSAAKVVSTVAAVAFLALLLDGHVALVSAMSARRRRAYAAASSLAFTAGLGFLLYWDDGSFTTDMEIEATLKPVPAGWVRGESLDDFLAGIDQLEREVARLADAPH